jgi:hypothetical protein
MPSLLIVLSFLKSLILLFLILLAFIALKSFLKVISSIFFKAVKIPYFTFKL